MSDSVQEELAIAQRKLKELDHKLRITTSQLQTYQANGRIATLTNKELNALSAETKVYKSIGQMYLNVDGAKLSKELEGVQAKTAEDVALFEKSKTELEQRVRASGEEMRALAQRIQGNQAF